MHDKLLIIGAGGHGRVIADIAKRIGNYNTIAFVDDDMVSASAFPYIYLGKCSNANNHINEYDMVVAIGNSTVRQKLTEQLLSNGANLATIVAPEAIIGSEVQLGPGTVVMPGAIINTGTTIGIGVIINTACSVDHDCNIGDYCHIAPGAHLCGTIHVGASTWIGAGTTVINNINICADCIIGAGAVVITDIKESGTYIGVPAKKK